MHLQYAQTDTSKHIISQLCDATLSMPITICADPDLPRGLGHKEITKCAKTSCEYPLLQPPFVQKMRKFGFIGLHERITWDKVVSLLTTWFNTFHQGRSQRPLIMVNMIKLHRNMLFSSKPQKPDQIIKSIFPVLLLYKWVIIMADMFYSHNKVGTMLFGLRRHAVLRSRIAAIYVKCWSYAQMEIKLVSQWHVCILIMHASWFIILVHVSW